ncbi:hypothetical protein DTO96_102219 [Ephemeroptericola cinctiostellae]|uniref:DUF1700 domain-containing protein n=1 Tax=Ephemeroptericola cinctiostellae TaxID=2268024 RepID=A0A345DDM7_9BURK|nr:DUF1700 domain-containing protein [Ephemeroptericola cinctiostellae]AXF86465.1 hypothetical protein DTO96_102219 [Ephemeroptericola cinctiostellae]
MNRDAFLAALKAQLNQLPTAQRDDIISDYAQYFDDAMTAGRNETDVIAQLGTPQQLARELFAQHQLDAWEAHKTPNNFISVLTSSFRLGAIRFGLSLPFLLGVIGSALLSLISYIVFITGILWLCLSLSQIFFSWPAPNQFILNDSGIGPWFVMTDSDMNAPAIDIMGKDNQAFKIEHQPDGGVTLHARDRNGELTLIKNADGSIKTLDVKKGEEHLQISRLHTISPFERLLLSLGMILASFFSIRLAKKWWVRTWAWWRAELDKHIVTH